MIDNLKFVKGALKNRALTPELEHYVIKNGRVTGFNGHMALSAPIDLTIEANPKANLFYKALEACGDTISLGMENGRLRIKSGNFSASLPCIDDPGFEAAPVGEIHACPPGTVAALARLLPFVSHDASRPWAMGVGISNGCMTATNNVIINQIWTGHDLPPFNCPRYAVAELVRIREEPDTIQIDPGSSVTFHWGSTERWLRTQLLTDEWPQEIIDRIFGQDTGEFAPFPEGFFAAVDMIEDFADESTAAVFEDGRLVAGNHITSASVEVPGLAAGPVFSTSMLKLLNGEVEAIDLSTFPNPCQFRGPSSRGVILGMRR